MPIRTNRGRAAVYRRLWGWPMRSPRHLLISVLVIAAVVIAVGLIVPRLTGSDDPPSGAASGLGGSSAPTAPANGADPGTPGAGQPPAAQPGASSSALPTRLPEPTLTPTSAPAPAEALDVATNWGKAFVNHPPGTTNEQWLAGLRPYTTEERISVMSSVDPANVPATEVTGPVVTVANYVSSVTVALPTNGGTVTLSLIHTPQGWRVAEYEQAGY